MNKYEALIIFREDLKDTDWETAVAAVESEIQRLDGSVSSTTRLGKREFARPLQKQLSGHYGLMAFELAGDKVAPLLARLKLDERVFRVQVVTAPPVSSAPLAPKQEMVRVEEEEEEDDGVSE
ncbi:MAG TPA: 30S ribosomal protein S6 [Kiritimatiellia bacterium]|nr:30S ribosomal protein S6 [Kiritimatiellia bacterium]